MWCKMVICFVILYQVAARSAEDCNRACQMILRPVCGSDGVTYPNQCHLDVAICQDDLEGRKLWKEADGACKVNKETIVCKSKCPKIYLPVCGSDGKTYANDCVLEEAVCEADLKGFKLSKDYDGPCKGEVQATKREQTSCKKPCPRHYLPVCGTDGVEYANQCLLEIAICESKDGLKLDYEGKCCPLMCPFSYIPVCGTDGVTYSNQCALEVQSCLSSRKGGDTIKIAHPGLC